ncbi:hypothetical protein KR009_005549 [Drosophila setifemur]|nr:hypothetical protein KR009_005549 [Drosophila setifemur]
MHRSVLLLLVSALVISAAFALPVDNAEANTEKPAHKDSDSDSDSDSNSAEKIKTVRSLDRIQRREVEAQEEGLDEELDAQAEKELEAEMAQALEEAQAHKENVSSEDYAQGCEVQEVSSLEANEATYAE